MKLDKLNVNKLVKVIQKIIDILLLNFYTNQNTIKLINHHSEQNIQSNIKK